MWKQETSDNFAFEITLLKNISESNFMDKNFYETFLLKFQTRSFVTKTLYRVKHEIIKEG